MFTGLVESLGTVIAVEDRAGGRLLVVAEPRLQGDLRIGDSIAINGACLTMVDIRQRGLAFQAVPETLAKTNLGELAVGDRVNLERALRVGDRLGGHWVQGHVDGVGRIAERGREGQWETVWFACAPALTAQMVGKGSLAVDGVSLTLVDVHDGRFSVALIPHTLEHTTLGFKAAGATVNLETDVLAKYVMKLLAGPYLEPRQGAR
jgi:riboflavin synthase